MEPESEPADSCRKKQHFNSRGHYLSISGKVYNALQWTVVLVDKTVHDGPCKNHFIDLTTSRCSGSEPKQRPLRDKVPPRKDERLYRENGVTEWHVTNARWRYRRGDISRDISR